MVNLEPELFGGKRALEVAEASKCDVGNWIFSKSYDFFSEIVWNFLENFLEFFGNFLGIFLEEFFGTHVE